MILVHNSNPHKSTPAVRVQMSSNPPSCTPAPEASAPRSPSSPRLDLKRNTLDFGEFYNASAARRNQAGAGAILHSRPDTGGSVRVPSPRASGAKLQSHPPARAPAHAPAVPLPTYEERLAQGLILVPRQPAPASPWTIPSPASGLSSPMTVRLQRPLTSGTRIVTKSHLGAPSHRPLPQASSLPPSAERDAGVGPPDPLLPLAAPAPTRRDGSTAGTLKRTSTSQLDAQPASAPAADVIDPRLLKKRRPSTVETTGDNAAELRGGEPRLSFAYMAQGASSQGLDQTNISSLESPVPKAREQPKPREAAQKPREKARDAAADASTTLPAKPAKGAAKGAGKVSKPIPKALSALEQLANAASLQAETERSAFSPALDRRPAQAGGELPAPVIRAQPGRCNPDAPWETLPPDNPAAASVPPYEPGPLHMDASKPVISTGVPPEGSPAPGAFAPPSKGSGAGAVVGQGLAGRVSNQQIFLKVASQKHPSQPQARSHSPGHPPPEAEGSEGTQSPPEASRQGSHQELPQPESHSAFLEAQREGLGRMRGFYSTPGSGAGHRVEQHASPLVRCISAEALVPQPTRAAASELPPLLPLHTHVADGSRSPVQPQLPGPSQAALALHSGASTWTGRVKHRLDTGEGPSVVELFSGSATFPETVLEQLPPCVFISELASRDAVRLKRHSVHHMQLAGLSQKQHLKLMGLAAMKLVGMARLQHCDLLFVFEVDVRQRVQVLLIVQSDDM